MSRSVVSYCSVYTCSCSSQASHSTYTCPSCQMTLSPQYRRRHDALLNDAPTHSNGGAASMKLSVSTAASSRRQILLERRLQKEKETKESMVQQLHKCKALEQAVEIIMRRRLVVRPTNAQSRK